MYKTENNHEEVFITELYDNKKYQELTEEILNSNIADGDVKRFLVSAASRFIDFNYYKIAQYYYNLKDEEIKTFFKKLNLVLVDDNDAIENGYVKLTKSIIENKEHYIKEK